MEEKVSYKLALEKKFDAPILDVVISPNGDYIAVYSAEWAGFYEEFTLMTKDGNILWDKSSEFGGIVDDTIEVFDNGDCIAEVCDNLTIFDKTGNMIWSRKIGLYNEYALSQNGFIATISGRDVAMYGEIYGKNFSKIWSWRTYYRPETISISDDGRYVIVSDRVWLYLFNKDGKLLWDKKVEDFFPEYGSIEVSFIPHNTSIAILWGSYLGILSLNGTWILHPIKVNSADATYCAKRFAISKDYIFTFEDNNVYVYSITNGKLLGKFSTGRGKNQLYNLFIRWKLRSCWFRRHGYTFLQKK